MKKLRKILFIITHLYRHCKVDKSIDLLVYKIICLIDSKKASIKCSYYELNITSADVDIIFWVANKYYAWGYTGTVNGFHWFDKMPSYSAIFDLKECLKRNNILIPKSPTEAISHILFQKINSISCAS